MEDSDDPEEKCKETPSLPSDQDDESDLPTLPLSGSTLIDLARERDPVRLHRKSMTERKTRSLVPPRRTLHPCVPPYPSGTPRGT